MKIKHLLSIGTIGFVIFSSCKKHNNEPQTGDKIFTQNVWTWDLGEVPEFISAPVPAIDEDDNSYYINKTSSGLIRILSLDKEGKKRFELLKNLQGTTNSSGSLIIDANNLYFYCNNTVYCYNKTNGNENWNFQKESFANSINNILVLKNNLFFTYSEDAGIGLQKLDSQGKSLWKIFIADYSTNLGIAATGDKLILINKHYYAYRFDMLAISSNDGTVLWKYDPNIEDVGSDPVVDGNGNVYIATYEGYLFSVNGNNGTLRWSFSKTTNSYASRFVNGSSLTVLPNENIIFSTADTVYCFDNTGHRLWSDGFWVSTLTLGDNNILYGWYNDNKDEASAELSLCAVNASDGNLIAVDSTHIGMDLKYSAHPIALDHRGTIITCGRQKIYAFVSLSNKLEENAWSKIGKGYKNTSVR